jgi:hypothetical protein
MPAVRYWVGRIEADAASPDYGTGNFVTSARGKMVSCVPVDDLVVNARPPDTIKCDVEGAEVKVLCVATNTLKIHRPWVLCETHLAVADRESRDIILTNLGGTQREIDANHFLALPAKRGEA